MINIEDLVDTFVEKVNASEREQGGCCNIPSILRLRPADRYGRQENIEWVDALEGLLPSKLPPSFRSLVTRYVYPAFKAGGLWFFANTREQTWDEWQDWLFKDKVLSAALLGAGYIQFARPDTGSYDPVCFDTRNKARDGECPIVWIDHEGILCDDKIIVRKEVAPSFIEFVQVYLSGEKL